MKEAYYNVIDNESIKNLQDSFCAATGVYAYCVDSVGMQMTELSGTQEDRKRLEEVISKERIGELVESLSRSTLEEQTVEDTQAEAVKCAAVCIRSDGKSVITWVVYAVLEECGAQEAQAYAQQFQHRISERQFLRALDLIREVSGHILQSRILARNAEAESRRTKFSKEETENVLKRMAATTEIVQLLDSDEPVEEIMHSILLVVGNLLNLEEAYLCGVESDTSPRMDVIAQWNHEGVVSRFDQTRNQSRPAYLLGKKPLVLSKGNSKGEYRRDMEKDGIAALCVLPIVLRDRIGMYACFEVRRQGYSWELEDIKFLNDSVKVLQSILTKRIQKNSLAGSYAALEEVLDNVGSAIYVRDIESGKILFTNGNFQEMLPAEPESDYLKEVFEKQIPDESDAGSLEICEEEKCAWYDLNYKKIPWVDGRTVRVCSIYDVTEKKMYQQKIERQAYTDFLTGLYNRLCCERDLARYVDEAGKDGTQGAVLYMDLDDFKKINDSLGHQYGDVLLKSIAQEMQGVEGIRNTCYRLGGDEFVVLIPPQEYERLDQIVEGVRTVFCKPWFLKDAEYRCTMSMGIAHFPADGEDVQELIKKADTAMYEAKNAGKDQVAVHGKQQRKTKNTRTQKK